LPPLPPPPRSRALLPQCRRQSSSPVLSPHLPPHLPIITPPHPYVLTPTTSQPSQKSKKQHTPTHSPVRTTIPQSIHCASSKRARAPSPSRWRAARASAGGSESKLSWRKASAADWSTPAWDESGVKGREGKGTEVSAGVSCVLLMKGRQRGGRGQIQFVCLSSPSSHTHITSIHSSVYP
jgi:hypothetical protein